MPKPASAPAAAAAPPLDSLTLGLPTKAATHRLGVALGGIVQAGDLIGLDGPLGAGKTTLVGGLAAGLGATVPATSPTFTLINEYPGESPGRPPLYHVDLYRLGSADELAELGLFELGESGGVMAVEWLSRFPDALPADRLEISLRHGHDGSARGRTVTLTARGPRSRQRLGQLAARLPPRS